MLRSCVAWTVTSQPRVGYHLLILATLATVQSLASPPHQRAQSQNSSPSQQNRNLIETEAQCKHYLCKYGYLNCNCTMYLQSDTSRYRREINPDRLPTELDESDPTERSSSVTIPPVLTTPSDQACIPTHFNQGYAEFQTVYRLPVTGYCDRRTKAFMSRRRCGQPDIFDVEDMMSYGHTNHPTSYQYQGYTNSQPHAHSSQRKRSSSYDDYSGESYDGYKRKRRSVDVTELLTDESAESSGKLISFRQQQLEEILATQPDNHTTYNNGQSSRTKRSMFQFTTNEYYGGFLTKPRLSWRLMSAHTSPTIPVNKQNSLLAQAFRYWSEVSPLCFIEDKHSQRVDIEIGFLEGTHLTCNKQFDGYGGEVAHKFFRDVHFDKTEPYSASNEASMNTISLTLVAVHEIGHVLGLNHSTEQNSVMNAVYHRQIRGDFELSNFDRIAIKEAYGPCTGSFDVVMDYVRTRGTGRVFNTFFFRGSNLWRYENNDARTRYGDPRRIVNNWNGIPTHLDTFMHFFESVGQAPAQIAEHHFFFKGSRYYRFDPNTEKVVQTGAISQMFRPSSTHPNRVIPNNLDAAFFDHIEKVTYFFKRDMVYKYKYRINGAHECCLEAPMRIVDLFPPVHPSHLYSPSHVTYTTDLDAVYLSWTRPYHLYLFKSEDVWRVEGYSLFGPETNETMFQVRYLGKWNTMWHYLCEAECT